MQDWYLLLLCFVSVLLLLSLTFSLTFHQKMETLQSTATQLASELKSLSASIKERSELSTLLQKQLELIDKQTSLLSAKGPLEYQSIVQIAQGLESGAIEYDPSDEAEIRRLEERGRLHDIYGDAQSAGPYFAVTDAESVGAGADAAEPYRIG
jgi:hypothetical protein